MYHPDGENIVYSLGSTVVIRNIKTGKQVFLTGHTDRVSCFDISKDGKYIASGQITHMGFLAIVIVWDFEKAIASGNIYEGPHERVYTLELHKVKVQAVAFSPSGEFLTTLGGQDDNNVVVWDMKTGDAICGSPSAPDTSLCLEWYNNSDAIFVTCGHGGIRIWEFDRPGRKIHPTDCMLGQYKRTFCSLAISESDESIFAGTLTGDILRVSGNTARLICAGDKRYSLGVTSLTTYACGSGNRSVDYLMFGTGDGMIGRCKSYDREMKQEFCQQVDGGVTAIAISPDFKKIMISTNMGNRYEAPIETMKPTLKETSHHSQINDVAFPQGCSELFATCSKGEIRLWNSRNRKELLRIRVPNQDCLSVFIAPDGKSIVSGWDDGKIRAFYPESGKLLYVIHDAHQEGVTALDMTQDSQFILSGGTDGQVRYWRLLPQKQRMEVSLKEHKGGVNFIQIRSDGLQAISASNDGSCLIWDMRRFIRLAAVYASTMFKCSLYHPDHSQFLTCGSDRKITYWDAVDANAIRIVTPKGCDSELTTLDITADGSHFVSGGGDKVIRIWDYDEGFVDMEGHGHSGSITRAVYTPDQKNVVSVGAEGGIFIWKL